MCFTFEWTLTKQRKQRLTDRRGSSFVCPYFVPILECARNCNLYVNIDILDLRYVQRVFSEIDEK